MDKVERVFRQLKAEGKIRIAKDVAIENKEPNFKAGSKKIKYNERMNELSEEDIEFGLLHEEGHFKCPVKKIDWFFLIIPLTLLFPFLLLVFMYPFLSQYIVYITFIYMLLYLFVYTRFWLSKFYQKYEYLADEYSCINLSNPLNSIYALDRIPNYSRNNGLKNIFIALGSKHAHPTHEQRIENIKEKFQNK